MVNQQADLTRIIGIDCATQPKNVGLALCTARDGDLRVEEVATCRSWAAIDERIVRWAKPPTLLAIDAPLGWPRALGEALRAHRAGAGLDVPPNSLFRRSTDDSVATRLGKRPLDVGSDRIARTAHAALALLARLREQLGEPIPLGWQPGPIDAVVAIEVYPAATLIGRGFPSSGYKGGKDGAAEVRQQLAMALKEEVGFADDVANMMVGSDHILDAVICACAGFDFLTRSPVGPEDLNLAKQEGWIWVRGSQG